MYKPLSLPWPNSVTYSFVIVYCQCSTQQFIANVFDNYLNQFYLDMCAPLLFKMSFDFPL